jgi:hypothetical protein
MRFLVVTTLLAATSHRVRNEKKKTDAQIMTQFLFFFKFVQEAELSTKKE